jgi:hypothetical protein
MSDTPKLREVLPVPAIDKYLGLERSQREELIKRGVIPVYRYPGRRTRIVFVDDLVRLQATAVPVTIEKAPTPKRKVTS